jgi:hypothetical protein
MQSLMRAAIIAVVVIIGAMIVFALFQGYWSLSPEPPGP